MVVALPVAASVVVVAWVAVGLVRVTGPRMAAMLVASNFPPVRVRP